MFLHIPTPRASGICLNWMGRTFLRKRRGDSWKDRARGYLAAQPRGAAQVICAAWPLQPWPWRPQAVPGAQVGRPAGLLGRTASSSQFSAHLPVEDG